jgi:hypothetical protein
MAEQQQGHSLPLRLAESVAGSILFGILATMWTNSPVRTVLVVVSTAVFVWILSSSVPKTPAGWGSSHLRLRYLIY